MTKPIDREQAHQVAADLLRVLDTEADPFLDEVLLRHGVRGLRVVSGLALWQGDSGLRTTLGGVVVGRVHRTYNAAPAWTWVLQEGALPEGHAVPTVTEGRAPTRLAADRALCLALRALGWAPVEVPPEPLEHLVELPPGFVEQDEPDEDAPHHSELPRYQHRSAAELEQSTRPPWPACPDCGGTGCERCAGEVQLGALDPVEDADRNGDQVDALRYMLDGIRLDRQGSRGWQQQYQQQPRPHDDGAAALRRARREFDSTRRHADRVDVLSRIHNGFATPRGLDEADRRIENSDGQPRTVTFPLGEDDPR